MLAGLITVLLLLSSIFSPSLWLIAITSLKITGVIFVVSVLLVAIGSSGFKN